MRGKGIQFIAIVIFLSSAVTFVSARNIMWQPHNKPPVLLEEALSLAKEKLKERGEFYCMRANLAKTFSQGDWELEMSSKDDHTFVSVASDKSVRISDKGFSYK